MDSGNKALISRGTGSATAGVSLQDSLQRGIIGRLLDALEKIKTALAGADIDLSFPRVVVCGQENSGKSSVLERICMLPFFPRKDVVTTRMPIFLRLHNATPETLRAKCAALSADGGQELPFDENAFYIKVSFTSNSESVSAHKEYAVLPDQTEKMTRVIEDCQAFILDRMEKQQRGSATMIEEPLSLEMWGTTTPDLELVDLPGLFAAWTEGEQKDVVDASRRITRKYLQDPNTIPVVVVDATTTSVRANVAFELLQQIPGKVDVAIGALTYADRCSLPSHSRSDPFMRLKARTRGVASDCPKIGGGYVALSNRDTQAERYPTLAQAAGQETLWFQENIPELLEEKIASAHCLVSRISNQMVTFTLQKWVPRASRTLSQHRQELENLMKLLGSPPESSLLHGMEKSAMQVLTDVLNGSGTRGIWDIPAPSASNCNRSSGMEGVKQWSLYCSQVASFDSAAIVTLESLLSLRVSEKLLQESTLPLRLSRFTGFHQAFLQKISSIVQSRAHIVKARWKNGFYILQVTESAVLSPSTRKLEERATALMQSILKEEIGLELLQMSIGNGESMHLLLQETCADERNRLRDALEAIDVAEKIIQELGKLGFT
jgi:hypothetical protein